MRCDRCGFENMPGLKTCVRCSSALVLEQASTVQPPRAGRTKFLRPIGYLWNAFVEWTRRPARKRVDGADYEGQQRQASIRLAVLSAIPGLGHLIDHRLMSVRWFLLGWSVSILLGLIVYGGHFAAFLFAGAAVLHAWIICDAGRLREDIADAGGRMVAVLIVFCLVFFGVYGGVRFLVGRRIRYLVAPHDMPDVGIRTGDGLLVWHHAYQNDPPRRRDVVFFQGATRRLRIRGAYLSTAGRFLGHIAAVPGDAVRTVEERIVVSKGGQPIALYDFPSPFPAVDVDILVKPNHCFVLLGGNPYGRALPPHALRAAFKALSTVPDDRIEDRVFMVYNPIWRRHFVSRGPAGR